MVFKTPSEYTETLTRIKHKTMPLFRSWLCVFVAIR